ncbi:MAG: penicillin acylase family protein [Planctomyces sp.]
MNSTDSVIPTELLRRLGAGESLSSVCQSAGWSEEKFHRLWKDELKWRANVKARSNENDQAVSAEIIRDNLGIPHLFADTDDDLWAAWGYATAEDRLFQLDYLRRRAHGRLSEILGREAFASDLTVRTVGLHRLAQKEWEQLEEIPRRLLQAWSDGINQRIADCGDQLPIEFALLGYQPEPWSPVDCVAIEQEFRWYLTGRFPIIVMPELAKRTLGEGPLYRELLTGEEDEEAIYPTECLTKSGSPRSTSEPLSRQLHEFRHDKTPNGCDSSGHVEPTGSNNWVVAGRFCRSGFPMLAGDPHIAIEAVSCWYEVHLCGGSFHVAGMAYAGIPAVICGRNEKLAWSITNNICSQRDLYREQTNKEHPGCFLFDEQWEPVTERSEVIHIRDEPSETRVIRSSRNGPVVTEILPAHANGDSDITLKWLGATHGGWLTSLLKINLASSVDEFHRATEPWHVPTFNLAVADVAGSVAMICTGRIPVRTKPERGYRPGWDPSHQWAGVIPFDEMPRSINPDRGWLVSANNRLTAPDFRWPVSGTWNGGHRGVRIRQMIESQLSDKKKCGNLQCDDFQSMQFDTVSIRAVNCLPGLIAALNHDPASVPVADNDSIAAMQSRAIRHLREWNKEVNVDLVAPTVFNVFFSFWCRTVSQARFQGAATELMMKLVEGFSARLLTAESSGCEWFSDPSTDAVASRIRKTFHETLIWLSERLGPDVDEWHWGRLHRLQLRHVLSSRGELSSLLNAGELPVPGDSVTVCNTSHDADFQAMSGAGYRMVVDLQTPWLFAMDGQSQSGMPGTAHYADQLQDWSSGVYHRISLNRSDLPPEAERMLFVRRTAG